jgi:general secretion pathway protein D
VYEKLIKRLDVRRPQVLVEATIVTLDTSDGFSLGVEITSSQTSKSGNRKYVTFSSFGLSDVDPSTGALTLKPGVGFNGALLSADVASAVIHALVSDSHAKVVSRPSVLVNDNAKGTLVSETEEPYASLNALTSVATTSFGGYASAGTSIAIRPQISEGEHLKLEYDITLSSFGQTRSDALPPPRKKDNLTSEATIPNGYTIVVGGLTSENSSFTADRLPLVGGLPGLEYFFSNRNKSATKTTLFVFIRAVILRDDKFKDLKFLSHEAVVAAELPGDFPTSEPVEIE